MPSADEIGGQFRRSLLNNASTSLTHFLASFRPYLTAIKRFQEDRCSFGQKYRLLTRGRMSGVRVGEIIPTPAPTPTPAKTISSDRLRLHSPTPDPSFLGGLCLPPRWPELAHRGRSGTGRTCRISRWATVGSPRCQPWSWPPAYIHPREDLFILTPGGVETSAPTTRRWQCGVDRPGQATVEG